MDHVNYEEFKDYILVNFANGRVVRFDLVDDVVSGKKYIHPKGEYTDDNSECLIVLPFDVYKENEDAMLHIRFVKN